MTSVGAIFGAGALGREVLAACMWSWSQFAAYRVVDDRLAGSTLAVRGQTLTVLARHQIQDIGGFVIAVAKPDDRRTIAAELERGGWSFGKAEMGAQWCDRIVGVGAILMPMSLVSVGATIGAHCILNPYASVGHDVHVGDFCTISSHVDICGGAALGDRVFIGSGARVLPGVTIGTGAYIGAGAVVVAHVPPFAKVFGNPARLTAGPT